MFTYKCLCFFLPCIFYNLVPDSLWNLLRQSFLLSSALIGQRVPPIDPIHLDKDARLPGFKTKIIIQGAVTLRKLYLSSC